jgi:hypothetical protein
MGLLEERVQVRDTITPVTSLVDAQTTQAALLGPRPNGVRMDAQQSRGTGDGEDRCLVARFDVTGTPGWELVRTGT